MTVILHDNALRLLHVLNHHVAYTIHFSIADIIIIHKNTGNVKNTEVRAVRPRDFNFQNFNGEILPTATFSRFDA